MTRPIRSNYTQIWVVTRHQYGISALVSQGLTYNEEIKLRRCNLKIKNCVQYDTIITPENLNEKKVNVENKNRSMI